MEITDVTDEIGVSVICNAYNQDRYIDKTLSAILEQRTKFTIEILVHDDASTDKTGDIIRCYEQKYPDIVKPIYQKKNQYSQNIDIMRRYQYPRVRGKYIAFCEGDDYWNDPLKLQKQYDAMEKNMDIDICAHAAHVINNKEEHAIKDIEPCLKNTIFPLSAVIRGGGSFVATNSLFVRARMLRDQPDLIKKCGLDYALQMYGSVRGGMLYLADKMSTYRYMVDGSWSDRVEKDISYKDEQFNMVLRLLTDVDEYTDHKYKKDIDMVISMMKFNDLMESGKYRAARNEQRLYFKQCSLKDKIYVYCMDFCPWLVSLMKHILR